MAAAATTAMVPAALAVGALRTGTQATIPRPIVRVLRDPPAAGTAVEVTAAAVAAVTAAVVVVAIKAARSVELRVLCLPDKGF